MLRQVLAIVILSTVIILGMLYAQEGVRFMLTSHDWISNLLKQVFSIGEAGNLTRQLLALLAVPIAVGLVPAVIWWLAKHKWFPYFMEIVWIVWLVQTSALVVLYKVVT